MHAERAARSFAGRSLLVGTAHLAAVGAGAIVWPLLARRLGPDGFGDFQTAQVVGGLLGHGVFFGLTQYSIWRFSDSGFARPVAIRLLKVRVANLASLLAVALPSLWVLSALGAPLPLWVLVVVGANLLRQMWPEWIFVSAGRTWALPVAALAAGAINAAGIYFLVRGEADLMSAALSYLVPVSAALVFLVVVGLGAARLREEHGARAERHRQASIPYGILAMSGQVIAHADVVVLYALGAGETVGLYAAAYRVVLVVQGFASGIQSVALSSFTEEAGRRSANGVLGPTVRSVSVLFCAGALALFISGPPVARLVFGDGYGATGRILGVLALTLPLDVVSGVGLSFLAATGRVRVAARCLGLGAGLSLVSAVSLTHLFGVWGTVAAKVGSVAAVCVLTAVALEHVDRRTLVTFGLGLPAAVGVLMVPLGAWSW